MAGGFLIRPLCCYIMPTSILMGSRYFEYQSNYPTFYPYNTFWYLSGLNCFTAMRLTRGVENFWPPNLYHEMRLQMLPRYMGFFWVEPFCVTNIIWKLVRRAFGVRGSCLSHTCSHILVLFTTRPYCHKSHLWCSKVSGPLIIRRGIFMRLRAWVRWKYFLPLMIIYW